MNNLKRIRTTKGFSQLTLAKLTNIAPSDISRIENGWVRPYAGWRKRLARALGVPEKELFGNSRPSEILQRILNPRSKA